MLNKKQFAVLERQAIVAALFKICDPRGMENLNLGDTVQLKSGGPVMTVGERAAGTDGRGLICQWFDGTNLKQGVFRQEQLNKAEPEKEWTGEGI